MVDNKKVMARNIKKYMDQQGVNATEICSALGFKQNTFSDWVNAKTYPRIDAIEKMANYFEISKANLVEEEVQPRIEVTKSRGKSHVKVYHTVASSHRKGFSAKEIMLVMRYRKADKATRIAVDKLLSYVEVKNDD